MILKLQETSIFFFYKPNVCHCLNNKNITLTSILFSSLLTSSLYYIPWLSVPQKKLLFSFPEQLQTRAGLKTPQNPFKKRDGRGVSNKNYLLKVASTVLILSSVQEYKYVEFEWAVDRMQLQPKTRRWMSGYPVRKYQTSNSSSHPFFVP